MKHLILACACLVVVSCTTVPPPKAPEPEKQYPTSGWKYSDLARAAVKAYGPALLTTEPKDIALYCPAYKTVDRAAFYDLLLSAMSHFESGWSTTQTYQEKFANVNGVRVISTGLLQVSIESCRAYGSSAKTTEELKDPEKNLECAVRVLNKWIKNDGVIAGGEAKAWLGGSRYWSVLRAHVADIRKLVGDKCI